MKSMGFSAVGLFLTLTANTAFAADPAEGEKVFRRFCTACHITTAEGPKRLGPPLAGIVGRKSGTIEGFRYSEANKNASITWSAQTLDPYLKDPKAVIPGTIMAFAGVKKDDERENLISYLQTLK
ncbi:MAG: cytochrome c family protein [Alphaproteobacteria bacterium]|nr:cytochrome c family protein [Alphaproteobacteria bacterium]